jgi:serpin B
MRHILIGIGVLLLIAGILLALFTGCSDDKITNTKNERNDGPASFASRIERNNAFAVGLFQKLADSDENLIVSPHSIATCFGMAYAGARGTTERQIADVLDFNYPPAGFHSVLDRLNTTLAGRPGVDLRISNGCWWQRGTQWEQAYLDTLSQSYDADMDSLDFAADPAGARAAINQWVSDHTAGLLNDLLPPGTIDASTVLVLANTIYFLAEWLWQFDPQYTHSASFLKLDASEVNNSFMWGEGHIPYLDGGDYVAIEMPYKEEYASMIFILPDSGCYEAFEDTFTVETFNFIADELHGRYNQCVMLTLPKFGFYSRFNLNQTLKEMGITDAYIPGVADFSGMDGTIDGSPWLDFVMHKAYLMINEYGTLAFAGTAMGFSVGICESFYANRPFIFAIQDIPTGTILFMGRVLDPSVGEYIEWPL